MTGDTTVHCCVSVDVDRFSDRAIRRDWLPMFRNCETPADVRDACARARGRGLEVFPSCDNPKPNGMCAGHPAPEASP